MGRKKKSGDSIYRPAEDEKIPSKPKPVDAPKRGALSAYFLYVKDHRAKTKEDNPTMTFGEIGRKMSENWKNNLSEEEKKEYEDNASVAKEEYKEAMQKYKKTRKYKKYIAALQEWNELYKDEWEEQQEEKEQKKKEKKEKKDSKKKKATKKKK